MFRFISAIGLAAIATSVFLPAAGLAQQGRPDTTQMSCARAQGLVQRAGGIVMRTGGQTYDRFVSGRAFCTPQEVTKPAFVPAGDYPQCFVGYTCEPYYPEAPDNN